MGMAATKGHLPEINAMRALAVLAVVVYHAFPSWAPGGFVGVDIFFVISGFVIARGYLDRLESGEVTFFDFYKKRVRRLLPASALVLLVTAFASVWILLPEDLISFGWSLLAQPFFAQNLVFWAEGDYFSGPLAKPLLHTWSLAVEEQFYLLWPLLILFFRRTRKWLLIIAVLSIISFAAGLLIEVRSPKTVFYLLPFRAWQFGLGMIAFLLLDKIPPLSAIWKHVALLCFFSLGIASSVFGGEWAYFPSIGNTVLSVMTAITLAIIACSKVATDGVFVKGPVPYIGETSYSFYLWHWPPLSLFFLAVGRAPDYWEAAILMAGAFAAASASYHLVENPIRFGRKVTAKQLVPSWGATSFGIFLAGAVFVWSQGLLLRYAEPVRPYLSAAMQSDKSRCSYIQVVRNPTAETCALHTASTDRPTVLFVGDSHVAVIKQMLAELGRKTDTTILLTVRNCDVGRFGTLEFCSTSVRDKLVKEAKLKSVDLLFAMSYWELDKFNDESLRSDLKVFSEVTSRIALVETVPFAPDYDPKKRVEDFQNTGVLDSSGINLAEFGDVIADVSATLSAGAEFESSNVKILRPRKYLCPESTCLYVRDGKVLYFDSNHLTLAGAELLEPMFRKEIEAISE